MPFAPPRPCNHAGCAVLVDPPSSRCDRHQARERKEQENRRGSANSRGYGSRWRAARKRFLELNPLCAECNRLGRVTAATVVDHVVPHKGDPALFWNQANWAPMCKRHHDEKTAVADGRWG